MSALPSSGVIGFSGGFIAILNPLAAVPTFVSLTTTNPELNRQHMAVTAAITVAVVLAGACLLGAGVLTTFGTDLNAFRVGGGLIVVLTGIRMATDAGPANARERSTIDGISIGAVPMALPLICGPTAISTVILRASGATGRAPVLAAFAVAAVTIWLTLTHLTVLVQVARHRRSERGHAALRAVALKHRQHRRVARAFRSKASPEPLRPPPVRRTHMHPPPLAAPLD